MSNKRYNFQKGSKSEQNVARNRLRAQEKAKEKKTEKSWADIPTTQQNHTHKQPYSRKFCLRTYISPDKIEIFLRTSPWISHWCYTTHDKDVDDDGNTKISHTHILLYTYSQKTASAIKKNFPLLIYSS